MQKRSNAMSIMDDLLDLGINVVLVGIADPSHAGNVDSDRLPLFTIELSRNTNIDAAKVYEIQEVLNPYKATIQFPSMNVHFKEDEETVAMRSQPKDGSVDENGNFVQPENPDPDRQDD